MRANRPVKDIHEAIVERSDLGTAFAVAVVLKAEGSTPCKAGAKAAIDARGAVLHGTIGGGAVEAEAQRRAVEAIQVDDDASRGCPAGIANERHEALGVDRAGAALHHDANDIGS